MPATKSFRHLITFAFVALASLAATQADDRPNIVLIMADDMGYSDIGCYGGEIETPNLDRLASGGLRFTQFYNTARCCPTRASLLTGLHPHQAGIGHMTNPPNNVKGHDRDVIGYRGFLNRECVTIAEALKPAGYQTLMSGKWHVGYHDKKRWPVQRGFDRYYGIISGASNFFNPQPPRGLTLDNDPVEPQSTTDRRYYTTDAFADYAIKFVKEAQRDQPFFLYLAFTSPHWPLNAHEEEIAKYRNTYKLGWEKLRQQRHARMIEMGLVDKKWPISDRDSRAWDSLKPRKQDEMDLRMAIYAAMVDRMDQKIGDLVKTLEELGELDNTLILFLSDNGGCAEGGMLGTGPVRDVEKRDAGYFINYGQAWANASNTPFRKYKHFTHEGGMATPLIAHWPKGVKARGELTAQPGYLPDIMPTLLEVAQAKYPREFKGHKIQPLPGISLKPALDQKPLNRQEPMCWEHEGNRAIRIGDWKLVSTGAERDYDGEEAWELYNLAEDRTELNNLARQQPERVKALSEQWWDWARKHRVVPNGLSPDTKPRPVKKPAQRALGNQKPNMLFVIADDLTFRDVGCYGGQAHTPNFDRLAKEGIRMTQCFQAAPMCSPTRQCLYSGLYPIKSGAYPNHTFVKDDVQSIVHYLEPLGYRVALAGKRHIAPVEAFPFEYLTKNNQMDFEAMENFIANNASANTPFCLFVCSNEPHEPWNRGNPSRYDADELKLPPNWVDTPRTRERYTRYLAETTVFDEELGRVLSMIEQHNLRDNTLVVAVTEQGSSFPLAKWTLYDDGIQAGMVARWPGRIKPGSTSDALVEYVDLVPTFVEAAGGKPAAKLDGKSMLPVLTGKTNKLKEFVFAQQTTKGIFRYYQPYGIRSIRSADYKLIWNLNPDNTFQNTTVFKPYYQSWVKRAQEGDRHAAKITKHYRTRPEFEFYDLKADPYELNNLANDSAYADRVAAYQKRLEAWMASQGDQGAATEEAARERMHGGAKKPAPLKQ